MRQNASLQLGTLYSEVYKEMQNNIKAKVIHIDDENHNDGDIDNSYYENNDDDIMIIVMI